jgi:hypothetical protein
MDWADDHPDAVVLTDQGQLLGALRVPHTAEGLDHLTRFLRGGASTSGAAEPVVCLVETQHGLRITALLEAGFTVCPVNPLAVGRLRPPSGVKTDALDARLLARLGRNDWPALRVLPPDGPLLQELKTLTRDLEGVLREQTRLVNQLTAGLKASSPAALRCFDGVTRPVTLAFLPASPPPRRPQRPRSTSSPRCSRRGIIRTRARRRSRWPRSCRRPSCPPCPGWRARKPDSWRPCGRNWRC